MLDRINSAFLALAVALLGAGLAHDLRFWDILEQDGTLARGWRVSVIVLASAPLLTWAAAGIRRFFRRGWRFGALLLGGASVLLAANLCFWGLVMGGVSPVADLYEDGRVVWIGDRAFLFGHGYWDVTNGYWQHQTMVQLPGGNQYDGSTLELLAMLRRRGAASVWGSWCYSGNYPYIRKDLVSGRRVPWPSFASYNTLPGRTIPIWLGNTFVRLGWPEKRYDSEPATIRPIEPDTLVFTNPTTSHIEQAFSLVQRRVSNLPRPDSVSWEPVRPDTVFGLSHAALAALPADRRAALQDSILTELKRRTKTRLAFYWIRGRAFPVYVRVPARLERPADRLRYADRWSTTRSASGRE